MENAETWTEIIEPSTNRFSLNLRKVWQKRDLISLFVKRDITTIYKQTVLGPLWLVLQPILTALVFTIIFSRLANLSTNGVPPFLFYFSGIFIWNFFSEVLIKTSDTFIANADLFGKVFFPRMVVPVSITMSGWIKLSINTVIFSVVLAYYSSINSELYVNWIYIWLFPVLVLLASFQALSIGMLISSLTTRYRDFKFLLQFGIQLTMYLSPIIYPLSAAQGTIHDIVYYNPMTPVIEGIRFIFLGNATLDTFSIGYSCSLTVLLFLAGTILFNRVERSFVDTV